MHDDLNINRADQSVSDAQISAVSKGVLARLKQLDKLPAFSRALQELEQLFSAPTTPSLDQIVEVVSLDPRLVAGLMGVANTAKYASYQKVQSLADALKRIGLNETRQLAHALQLQTMMGSSNASVQFNRDVFIRNAMVSAFLCRELALLKDIPADVSFLMGLMRDIGHYLLYQENEKSFQKALQWMQKNKSSCHDAEQKIFKTSHSAVGARLLQQWQFPIVVIMGVAGHTRPDTMPTQYAVYARLAQLSELLSLWLGFGYAWQAGVSITDNEQRKIELEMFKLAMSLGISSDEITLLTKKALSKAEATGLL